MPTQPDLFPEDARRRCPLCRGVYTRGCVRCELHHLPPPPLDDQVVLEMRRARAAEEARCAGLQALGRPVRVALVSCSNTKLEGSHPARELYSSPLFRLSVAYAEAHADEIRILSARYGVVAPDRVLESYDQRLPQRQRELALWGINSRNTLSTDYLPLHVHLLILAGQTYASPILTAGLPPGWTYHLPLDGLQIGQRLSFLSSALRGAPTARAPSGGSAAPETP